MTAKDFKTRNKQLPENQAILRIAGHDYLVTFESSLDRLCAVRNITTGYITNLETLYSYNITSVKEVFGMRYFLITGLENGVPIEPYMVETNGELPALTHHITHGDSVRYLEDIGRSDVIKNLKAGMTLED